MMNLLPLRQPCALPLSQYKCPIARQQLQMVPWLAGEPISAISDLSRLWAIMRFSLPECFHELRNIWSNYVPIDVNRDQEPTPALLQQKFAVKQLREALQRIELHRTKADVHQVFLLTNQQQHKSCVHPGCSAFVHFPEMPSFDPDTAWLLSGFLYSQHEPGLFLLPCAHK